MTRWNITTQNYHYRLFELVNRFWCRCKQRRRGIGGSGSGVGCRGALVQCWTFGASIHDARLSFPLASLVSDSGIGICEARSQARSGLGFVECSSIAADRGRRLVIPHPPRWLSATDCRVSRNGCHSDRFNVECGRGSCAWFSSIDECTPKAVGVPHTVPCLGDEGDVLLLNEPLWQMFGTCARARGRCCNLLTLGCVRMYCTAPIVGVRGGGWDCLYCWWNLS
jgi:hypothetical protein